MRYVTINKFAWLDPTNEILKGPSQGKSAGAFNTLTAQQIQVGDPNEIGMYTNLMLDIENTLGKIAGVTGAREGQIQNREAVNNVEREVAQTSHITEKWFAIDNNFRKRVLTKFLECCKYAYKTNPKKGQYLLDDMGQQLITHFDEFCATEYDLHLSNSSNDQQLFNDLKALSQAAIQNGQATISDLIAISQSESVQDVARKLEDSARKIREENQKIQQQQLAQQDAANKAAMQDKQAQREWEVKKHEDDIAIERERIESNILIASIKEENNNYRNSTNNTDTDNNGVGDLLDLRRTEVDENFKQEQINLKQQQLEETVRANKAKEELQKKSIAAQAKRASGAK
jgi:hypothetical protein